MHQVWLECLVQLPDLRPVTLIAVERQRAEALAHLVPGTLIAGVVHAAVDAREASLLFKGAHFPQEIILMGVRW
jgi:hypothetical protein